MLWDGLLVTCLVFRAAGGWLTIGVFAQLTPTEWEKSAFEGDDEDFLNMVLPGANLDPEVHLNKEGEIRADHDDPNGKLMPHNKYQEARYGAESAADW